MVRVGCAASYFCSDTEKCSQWRSLNFLPASGVFQEASHGKLNWSFFGGIVRGCFKGEVTGCGGVGQVVVARLDGADDSDHRAPLFW